MSLEFLSCLQLDNEILVAQAYKLDKITWLGCFHLMCHGFVHGYGMKNQSELSSSVPNLTMKKTPQSAPREMVI